MPDLPPDGETALPPSPEGVPGAVRDTSRLTAPFLERHLMERPAAR